VGKWYCVIVMSGIQLGSGQIAVFAVIPKLVLPCCHTSLLVARKSRETKKKKKNRILLPQSALGTIK
jgi:hypothetical protein